MSDDYLDQLELDALANRFYEDDDREGVFGPGPQPGEITCHYCGKKGLSWEQRHGRWCLVNGTGLHACGEDLP